MMRGPHGVTTAFPDWWAPPPTDRCADPGDRAVLLLYTEALAHIRAARRAVSGLTVDMAPVLLILVELQASLAQRDDPEAVVNLAGLYRYMIHRVVEVTEWGTREALVEVEQLLQTLSDGWVQVMEGGDEAVFPPSLQSDDQRMPFSPLPT